MQMNAVGIDVSKGKSMIAVMRPFGEIVASPFEVTHDNSELSKLAGKLKSLNGETKVIMECTGVYHLPIAHALREAGLMVCTVHPMLIHDFGNNSIRKVKTDKADAIKIANYGLTTWLDFAAVFWHCECVCGLSQKAFAERYRKWCKRAGYNFSQSKADSIYVVSCGHPCVMPKNETTKLLVTQAIAQINAIAESLSVISREMRRIATLLPEYSVVMAFNGVGETLGYQLMAEIGDVYRFSRKESLVCFAGLEAPPHQSGKFESENRSISKKGSPHLRKTLFQVMDRLPKHSPATDPVYQFLDRKRTEGKHYYSYMTAGSAKFLSIYYARVKEFLNKYYS
jgi:transposase